MVWVRVQVPARALFSPVLSLVRVSGFCCGAPPGAPAFAFLPFGARVSWVARLVGWLAFRAVAPHFSHAVCYLVLLLPVVACAVRFAVRRFKGR